MNGYFAASPAKFLGQSHMLYEGQNTKRHAIERQLNGQTWRCLLVDGHSWKECLLNENFAKFIQRARNVYWMKFLLNSFNRHSFLVCEGIHFQLKIEIPSHNKVNSLAQWHAPDFQPKPDSRFLKCCVLKKNEWIPDCWLGTQSPDGTSHQVIQNCHGEKCLAT